MLKSKALTTEDAEDTEKSRKTKITINRDYSLIQTILRCFFALLCALGVLCG